MIYDLAIGAGGAMILVGVCLFLGQLLAVGDPLRASGKFWLGFAALCVLTLAVMVLTGIGYGVRQLL